MKCMDTKHACKQRGLLCWNSRASLYQSVIGNMKALFLLHGLMMECRLIVVMIGRELSATPPHAGWCNSHSMGQECSTSLIITLILMEFPFWICHYFILSKNCRASTYLIIGLKASMRTKVHVYVYISRAYYNINTSYAFAAYDSNGSLKQLKILNLCDNFFDDSILPYLNTLTSLTTLNLYYNCIEGSRIKQGIYISCQQKCMLGSLIS